MKSVLPETFVRAYCALGHSWTSPMTPIQTPTGNPRRPVTIEPMLTIPDCPNCGRRWERSTDTRHGGG